MANAWAFSALRAGLAFIAKLLAMGFKTSSSLPKTAAGTVTGLVIGVISGIGRSQSNNQRNRFLCSMVKA